MTEINLAKLAAPFPRDRVSWRAQTVTKDGSKALALGYIDARDVQDRLDQICGPENWQNRFPHADKKTVCEIGIRIGGEWVWKADGAGDSDIEAEKGALSDAFKRCAVKWGIGRYLYDLETPWVPCESRDGPNGKKMFVKFTADPWQHVRNAPAIPKAPTEAPPPPQRAAIAWDRFHADALKQLAGKSQPQCREWWKANLATLGEMSKNAPDLWKGLKDFCATAGEDLRMAG